MKQMLYSLAILGYLLFVSGCATTSIGDRDHRDIPSLQGEMFPSNNPEEAPGEYEEPKGTITLADAVQAALRGHPGLAAAWHEVRAREGAERQAGLPPNPTIFGEVDEFGGSGGLAGTDAMETSIGINQEIPLGRKISRSKKVAKVDTDLARLDRVLAYLELRTAVRKRFLRVYVLQETLGLEERNLERVVAMHDAIIERVRSGDVPPLDQAKASVALASARVAVERVKRDLAASRYALAAVWGSKIPAFTRVKAEYSEIPDLPDDEDLFNALESSPAYRHLDMQVSREHAAVGLAGAEAWPDLEVEGGVRKFRETSEHAFFLELSIPIPLFDRNQGGIQEAWETLNKTWMQKEAGLLELRSRVIEIAKRLRAIRADYDANQQTILPVAEQMYEAVAKAYRAGEQDYLELLDAQRTLLDARRPHLELLTEYYDLKSDLDELIPEEEFLLQTADDGQQSIVCRKFPIRNRLEECSR